MLLLSIALALPLIGLGALSSWNRAKADARRVAALGQQGTHLGQPHFVSFRFIFNSESSAQSVADTLRTEYECTVTQGAVTGQVPGENEPRTINGYVLVAVRPIRLEPQQLQGLGLQHAHLARSHSGYYMGWEPTLVRSDA
jgi:Regulator of ribonuclease activity B